MTKLSEEERRDEGLMKQRRGKELLVLVKSLLRWTLRKNGLRSRI